MKKYAFTLAEILIVMTVIGVIAVLCVPAIMMGVTNARYQANYKRAYKTIHSIMAVEQLNGRLPISTTKEGLASIYEAMLINLNTKEYAPQKENGPNDGILTPAEEFKHSISFTGSSGKPTTYGTTTNSKITDTNDWTSVASPWIITEDNLAYSITGVSNSECFSKEELNAQQEISKLNQKSCAIVVVDVNGLMIGPNLLEEQVINGVNPNGKINTLKKDRYYIYIGKNGVATGPKNISLSGRLINNLK